MLQCRGLAWTGISLESIVLRKVCTCFLWKAGIFLRKNAEEGFPQNQNHMGISLRWRPIHIAVPYIGFSARQAGACTNCTVLFHILQDFFHLSALLPKIRHGTAALLRTAMPGRFSRRKAEKSCRRNLPGTILHIVLYSNDPSL